MSCHFQSKPRSAHLRVHHGLPHHPLPAACVWAKVPPHDPPLHGNGNKAVRHVHRRWPQRLCRLWLHASGTCASLEANAGIVSRFSLSPSRILILDSFSGTRCEVFPRWPLSCWHHWRVKIQGPQPWPERRLPHRQDRVPGGQKGMRTVRAYVRTHQHMLFFDLVDDRGPLP